MNSSTTTNASANTSRKTSAGAPSPAGARLILYARKSTESEDRQVQSIDDQSRLCQETAREQGFTIVRVIGEARSAKQQGTRPGFIEMIEALEKGEADGVITWHPDRLARNAVDGGWILDLLDRGRIKHLLFASSYTFENTPEGKFMLGMIFTQSKYYVDKLSKDVLRGMNSKRDKGHFPHRAPEGYLNNMVEKTIEADPLRFPLLRQAIEQVLAQVLSPSKVLYTLNNLWGYRTRKTKRTGGGPLSRTSFYDLLSNPFYYGVCREKDLTYPGSHPPLLSQDEFDRIQTILGKSEKPMAKKHAFALTGLIRCGRCGCMVTATKSKGHTYYHCSNSRGVCDRKGIREERLAGQVEGLLERLTIPDYVEPLLLKVVRQYFEDTYGKGRQVTASKHRAEEDARKQLQTLMSLRLRDFVSDEEFMREKGRLNEEIARLKREEAASEHEMERALETAENVIHYAAWAKEAFAGGTPDEKRRIVEMLGSRYVLTGQSLLLELHPYLALFDKRAEEIQAFKPSVDGSQSAKRTVSEETVLYGWASGLGIELGNSITALQKPFFPIPKKLMCPIYYSNAQHQKIGTP